MPKENKLYTFLDDEENIIEEVIASSHDEAVEKAGSNIKYSTAFYSEKLASFSIAFLG